MEGNGNRGLEKNSQFDWNVEVSKNFSNFAMQVKRKKEIFVSIVKFKINLNKIWKFLYYKYRGKKVKMIDGNVRKIT